MSWVQATSVTELKQKSRVVLKKDGLQVVVFLVKDQIYAIDNRCPHEGYPLREGTIDDKKCVLTCQWHNWKFELKSGKSTLGEDHVRTYPVKQEGDSVWVELLPPDPKEAQKAAMKGLKTAMNKHQYGRMAREVTRLITTGNDPRLAVAEALRFAHDKFEYGTSHAMPATADWLDLYSQYQGAVENQVICITEAIDHIAYDVLREPTYPFTARVLPFDGTAFTQAIEAQEEDKAIAYLNGAIAEGLNWENLEYWFIKAALAHYNAFGHSLIYTTKVPVLIEHLGQDILPYVLLPLVRQLCMATREDLVPDFRSYARFINTQPASFGPDDSPIAQDSFFGLGIKAAMEKVHQLSSFHTPEVLYHALFQASAYHMLHFDLNFEYAFDNPVNHNVSRLDVTHALTFASAARNVCRTHPEFWYPCLLQMACFVGRNKPYLKAERNESQWLVENPGAFFEETLELILDHGLGLPIYACHILKTALAIRQEVEHFTQDQARIPLASLNRIFREPVKQKHTRRLARQALSLAGYK